MVPPLARPRRGANALKYLGRRLWCEAVQPRSAWKPRLRGSTSRGPQFKGESKRTEFRMPLKDDARLALLWLRVRLCAGQESLAGASHGCGELESTVRGCCYRPLAVADAQECSGRRA